MSESDNMISYNYKIIWNYLISIGKGSATITCGLLSIFIIKGNAKVQLEVSTSKNTFFLKLRSQTPPAFSLCSPIRPQVNNPWSTKKICRKAGKRHEQIVRKKI